MRRVFLLIGLFLVLILGSALQPGTQDAPTWKGVFSYRAEGPGAVPGGMMSLIEGQAILPVSVARLKNLIDLVLKAPPLAENPSMKNVGDWMNQGVGVDLSVLLPTRAYYWADLKFSLTRDSEELFHLEKGTLSWGATRSGELAYDGAHISEKFSGSGSVPLDPGRDLIDLKLDLRADTPTFQLDMKISHPLTLSGSSEWVGPEQIFNLSLDARKGIFILDGSALGQSIAVVGAPVPLQINDEPAKWGFGYSRTGGYSDLKGTETWRNITDATEAVSYEIYMECQALWSEPMTDKFTFSGDQPGKIEETIKPAVSPEVWADDLSWTIPEIDGAALTVTPEDKKGGQIEVLYQGLPEDNRSFGDKEFEFDWNELKDECTEPKPKTIRFLYSRDERNNPDGDVPNWFYYWLQTRAAQWHRNAIEYDGECLREPGESNYTLEYFLGYGGKEFAKTIYICNLEETQFQFTNPVTLRSVEGIDVFGETVLHEWTHLKNYWDWWGERGYRKAKDRDRDHVPDDREAGYGLDPLLNDTFGLGYRDSEYPAYLQGNTWPIGAADKEDWADPGKQSQP